MTSGRELDALIAEKVMGWIVAHSSEGFYRWKPKPDNPNSYSEWQEGLPHYSTNIADAWHVVEKLKEYGNVVEVKCFRSGSVDVQVRGGNINDIRGAGNADTAPLAICLAALKAVGE